MSEWPRSKFQASAVRQRRNFGHRNRIIGPYESATRSSVNGPSGTPAPTEFFVGVDDPVRPGPDNATPCRAGPVCPAVGAKKEESPSHGFRRPFRQGAKEIRIATTSESVTGFAMTVFSWEWRYEKSPPAGAGGLLYRGYYCRSRRLKTRVNRATVSIIPMTMK